MGGRMSRNADDTPGRTEKLIPLVRRTFGQAMTLYGDAKSYHDGPNAVRIGRLIEGHGYGSARSRANSTTCGDEGGGRRTDDSGRSRRAEYSMHRRKWVIANCGADIIQPDLLYGG